MKQIKSFEFRPGFGSGIEFIDQKVNEFISSLEKQGITDVDLKIIALEKVLIYSVIWNS